MSYSIIRVAKVKSKTNTTGIQKHVQRENKNYENLDIDLEQSHLNYDLVNDNPINYNLKIDKKIEENYTGKRKIRSDAVKHIDGIITSDKEFFQLKSEKKIKEFFEDSKQFLEDEYGKDNLLYAAVHMDEKTPHMHYGVVPITTDGRLSAKDVVGNKKALTEFQDRFNQYMNDKGYNLERGESKHKTERKHQEVEQYKSETKYHESSRNQAYHITEFVNDRLKRKEEYNKKLDEKIEIENEKYKQIQREMEDLRHLKIPKLKQVAKDLNEKNINESEILEDKKQEKVNLTKTISSIQVDIDKIKAEKDEYKLLRDQIRDDKEKQEEEYQSLMNILNEPVNDQYEHEYKKPSLFAKEKEATGKVILPEDDYKTLKKQAALSKRLEPEYKRVKSGEERQEDKSKIESLEKENRVIKKNYNKLSKSKNQVVEEKEQEEYQHILTKKIVNHGCKFIKNTVGEKAYQKGLTAVDNTIKPEYRKSFRMLASVDENDKQMFESKDVEHERQINQQRFEQQISESKQRDKGFDLDL